jgi:Ca2+-binding RTX toxin-like protein
MAEITGTDGNDTLTGTDDDDVISPLRGVDTVRAGRGNDRINLILEQHGFGNGTDLIDGGEGVDTLALSFASFSSFNAYTLALGASISGTVGLGNVVSTNISGIERITANLDTGRDTFELTLAASVSSDIFFDIDAGFAQFNSDDRLDIIATQAAQGVTITNTNGEYGASFGRFRGFEQFVFVGSAFGDNVTAASSNDYGASLDGRGGDDQLTGGVGRDFLSGGDGNDILRGGAGNDFIDGGVGADQLFGEDGDDYFVFASIGTGDVVDGGNGNDVINFNFTNATSGSSIDLTNFWTNGTIAGVGATFSSIEGIAGYEGSDFDDSFILGTTAPLPSGGSFYFLNGRSGNDVIGGSNFADVLSGGDGNDQITANAGDDSVNGGAGNDTIFAGDGNDYVDGFDNDDTIHGDAGNDRLEGWAGADILYGGAGNDSLNGTDGFGGIAANDQLSGGDGDDNFLAGSGDSISGGAGRDILAIDASNDNRGLVIDFNSAAQISGIEGLYYVLGSNFDDVIILGDVPLVAPTSVTNWFWNTNGFTGIRGGAGNDRIVGSASDDELFGDAGADELFGGLGNDRLQGGGGDRMYGGQGSDWYRVFDTTDIIFENAGEGTDSVEAHISHYLFDNVENLTLNVFAGNIFGVGNDLANTIIGNVGDNLLIGGGGNDVLDGGVDGRDSLFGEAGDDLLQGGTGIDYLVGGIGNDRLEGGLHADALYGEDGDDLLEGGTSFDTDILVGGAGNDTLNGVSGQPNPDYDLMDGGSGDDIYYVDTGADLTFEAVGGGVDTVYANVIVPNAGVYLYANIENLVLQGTTAFGVGNELNNSLLGSGSGNWLLGGAGDDNLNGMGGNDVLFGEGGNDVFAFVGSNGADVIGDFMRGQDRIDLSAYGRTFAQWQAGFVQVGNNGAIDLGNGNLIVLLGVTMSQLTAADFILAPVAEAPLKQEELGSAVSDAFISGSFADANFADSRPQRWSDMVAEIWL